MRVLTFFTWMSYSLLTARLMRRCRGRIQVLVSPEAHAHAPAQLSRFVEGVAPQGMAG